MLQDKTMLLTQIETAIKNNTCIKRNTDNHSNTSHFYTEFITQLRDDRNVSVSKNFEYIKNLEQRLKSLEDQCDHLLCFIHYLFENFPDLVREVCPAKGIHNIDNNGQADSIQGHCDMPYITRREEEILHLLERGLCAKEIASYLFICETTVITHKKNLKKKFNAKNTAELISKASLILIKPASSSVQ